MLIRNKNTRPPDCSYSGDRVFSFHDSFISKPGRHLQHVDADLLWIIIQTDAENTWPIRYQYPTIQLVGLVLLVLLIFLVGYRLHNYLNYTQ
ncbi:MAG: hypothetical protein IJ225_02455 [Solobacterium sp.]|nr:hypothetical protein [Solobacterium sp.]